MLHSTSSQIEDENVAFVLEIFVEAVGERGRRGLVDDAKDVEAGDEASVLGRLTLRVVEVGGHGDDRVGNLFAQVVLRRLLHLGQHHGAYLLGREHFERILEAHLYLALALVADHLEGPVLFVLVDNGVVEAATDEPLGVEYCVLRIGGHLVLGAVAHQTLALRERHIARRGPVALIVGDDLHLAVEEDGHTRIGRAQVNTDRVRGRFDIRVLSSSSHSIYSCLVFCLSFDLMLVMLMNCLFRFYLFYLDSLFFASPKIKPQSSI